MTGGTTGGMLTLRIGLQDAGLVDLARTLAKLGGVRVTSGPAIVNRGDCYLVHCPGFKMVLSSPAEAGDFAQALVSRTIEPVLAIACELSILLDRLMAAPAARAERPERAVRAERKTTHIDQPAWQRTSTLRRATLQPGKTLLRKTPLTRKAPLARGPRRPPRV
jgi:hypothetical protein